MTVRIVPKDFEVKTRGENDVLDMTDHVLEAVRSSKLSNGVATLFVSGSTAAVTTIEFEPGLLKDFPAMLERVAPKDASYEHQKKWHDDNGRSHVKSSLVGPSLSVPFRDGVPTLGDWQQIVLVELDIRPRTRKIIMELVGE